jgi:putative addiction module CopG family antidote
MDATRRLEIELPEEMADAVRAHVESGRFASESEVVAAGLALLQDQEDDELEDWVREEIAAAYDEWQANPTDVYTVEEVRAHLEQQRQKRG